MPFNRNHPPRQLGQNGRLIATARANLQHRLAASQLQRVGHPRHHTGHGDGLPLANRQARVIIGLHGKAGRQKHRAGRAQQRVHHWTRAHATGLHRGLQLGQLARFRFG